MKTHGLTIRAGRRGSALMIMTLLVVVMAGASFALLQANLAGHREQRGQRAQSHVRYVCQAGLADAMYNLQRGAAGTLGSEAHPIQLGTSQYYVSQTNPAPDLITLRSTGIDDKKTASMELVVRTRRRPAWSSSCAPCPTRSGDSAHSGRRSCTWIPTRASTATTRTRRRTRCKR
jgi:hypothetical protein